MELWKDHLRIIKGMRDFVGKKDPGESYYREALRYIRAEVYEDKIVFTATDSYCIARYTIHGTDNGQHTTVFVDPAALRSLRMADYYLTAQDDKLVFSNVKTGAVYAIGSGELADRYPDTDMLLDGLNTPMILPLHLSMGFFFPGALWLTQTYERQDLLLVRDFEGCLAKEKAIKAARKWIVVSDLGEQVFALCGNTGPVHVKRYQDGVRHELVYFEEFDQKEDNNE